MKKLAIVVTIVLFILFFAFTYKNSIADVAYSSGQGQKGDGFSAKTADVAGSLEIASGSSGSVTISGPTGTITSYTATLPSAQGTSGQALTVSSVSGTNVTLGFSTVATGTGTFSISSSIVTTHTTGVTADFGSTGLSPIAIRSTAPVNYYLPASAASLYRPFILGTAATYTVNFIPSTVSDIIKYNGTTITTGHRISCNTSGLLTSIAFGQYDWSFNGLPTCVDGGIASMATVTNAYSYGTITVATDATFTATNGGSGTTLSLATSIVGSTAYAIASDTCTTSVASGATCTTVVTATIASGQTPTANLHYAWEQGQTYDCALSGTGGSATACTGSTIQAQQTLTDQGTTGFGVYTTQDAYVATNLTYTGTTGTLCRLDIYTQASATGGSGNLHAYLYSSLSPTPNVQISDCGSKALADLATSMTWTTFNCGDVTITNGVTYDVVLYYDASGNPATIYPKMQKATSTGNTLFKANTTPTWVSYYADRQFDFKLYIKE